MIMQIHGSAVALAAASHASVAAHAHGDALAIAVMVGALGLTLWAYGHVRRLTCWLIAGAAAFIGVGFTVWTDSLVGITSSGPGLVILGVLVLVSPFAFYYEAVHHPARRRFRQAKKQQALTKRAEKGNEKAQLALAAPKMTNSLDGKEHHHRVRTPAIAAVFGTVVALGIVSSSLLLTAAKEALMGAGQAFSQTSAAVSSGQAQTAMTHGHAVRNFFIGLAIFIVGVYILHRIHQYHTLGPKKDRPKKGAKGGRGGGGRGGQPAVGTGQRAIGG